MTNHEKVNHIADFYRGEKPDPFINEFMHGEALLEWIELKYDLVEKPLKSEGGS